MIFFIYFEKTGTAFNLKYWGSKFKANISADRWCMKLQNQAAVFSKRTLLFPLVIFKSAQLTIILYRVKLRPRGTNRLNSS